MARALYELEPTVFRLHTAYPVAHVDWCVYRHQFVWGDTIEHFQSHVPARENDRRRWLRSRGGPGGTAPSAADLVRFWKILDLIGVWDWEDDYDDSTIFDGDPWELNIEYGDFGLATRGNFCGRHPPNWDLFDRSLNALLHRPSTLLSGKTIYDSWSELLKLAADVSQQS
jgi:hypothetical protein